MSERSAQTEFAVYQSVWAAMDRAGPVVGIQSASSGVARRGNCQSCCVAKVYGQRLSVNGALPIKQHFYNWGVSSL